MQALFDAQLTLGFLISQTSHIEPGVYKTQYPELDYASLVPVDYSASPFAKTVTYYSSDMFGKAEWLNGNSDDVPMAGTNRAKHETDVFTAGIGYGWGWEELEQARMLGINLPADDAEAARRAYEQFVYNVALFGDTEKGFEGLFNNSSVTPGALPTGDWANPATTGDQIVADLNAMIVGIFTGSNTVEMADTLLLPWSKFLLISTKRMSSQTDTTVLQYFIANNAYTAMSRRPLTIRGFRGLDTIGESGGARIIAYKRDPGVLKMHIPMPHRFFPARQASAFRFEVPGAFRLGGLDIRRPKAVYYGDGA